MSTETSLSPTTSANSKEPVGQAYVADLKSMLNSYIAMAVRDLEHAKALLQPGRGPSIFPCRDLRRIIRTLKIAESRTVPIRAYIQAALRDSKALDARKRELASSLEYDGGEEALHAIEAAIDEATESSGLR